MQFLCFVLLGIVLSTSSFADVRVPRPAHLFRGKTAPANGLDLWYETFGNPNDPAVLLIMGAGAQGILWPTEFCYRLSAEKFYVIRYDHRDAGMSTHVDFEQNPYTLSDMAEDAACLLDALNIARVHLVGLSMGGPVAEILAAEHPERILSLALVATSPDFRPVFLALEGKSPEEGSLSQPAPYYLSSLPREIAKTDEEKLEQNLTVWRLANGAAAPFEEERYREIFTQILARAPQGKISQNHVRAMKESLSMIQEAPFRVCIPTLVLQGSVDPIFPPDHGETLASIIPGAKYVLVEGQGHIPNRCFYDLWIQEIKENALRGVL